MRLFPRSMLAAATGAATLFAALLPVSAAETNVAVAANFTEAAKEIAQGFEAATGHKAVLSFGATGQFYTQITQDAPFAVFLAADSKTPKKAEEENFAVAGTAFPYAVGKLVLWSAAPGATLGEETLRAGAFEKIAIANPKVAPYGAAAVEVMEKLGVYQTLEPKIVQGNNIAQTFQFVETGNAEVGFVALSQVIKRDGSRWVVPASLHTPIQQGAVLLKKGENDPAARAFIEYLKGPEARAIIETYGYGTGSGS